MILRNTGIYILACVIFVCLTINTAHGAVRTVEHTETASSTKYAIPIPVLLGVSLTDIVPDFGDPRGGGTRVHEGQDIMAPEGTPIVSPVKGTVIRFGTAETPGKYVYVRGVDGYTYAFMHLDEIARLKRGQKLSVGDFIGTVGETGNAKGTTPHLHFEIRKRKPVDPYTRITKEFTLEEKIAYLNKAVSKMRKPDTFISSLTETYEGVLLLALHDGLTLDARLKKALSRDRVRMDLASSTPGLRMGDRSSDVSVLQRALMFVSIGSSTRALALNGVTGYFGPLTEAALREYQTTRSLLPTGIFDTHTKAELVHTLSL